MVDESQVRDRSVDEGLLRISKGLQHAPEFSHRDVPGLNSLLEDDLDPEKHVPTVDFLRRLLKVFKDSEADDTYSSTLAQCSRGEKQVIEQFLGGENPETMSDDFVFGPSLGCREELQAMADAQYFFHIGPEGVQNLSNSTTLNLPFDLMGFVLFMKPVVEESERDRIMVSYDTLFQNLGRTVESRPRITCMPTTVAQVQRIVRYAKDHDMVVRCAGFRHSWSPIFPENGQILISMLNVDEATDLPSAISLPSQVAGEPNHLQSISKISPKPIEDGNYLVRVGAACTNERLRQWCVSERTATLPLNAILVEVTLGGANATMCHGAGRRHKTLSDLVRRIEYVDCNGEFREITKPEHLRAASGCFGLLGIVTHITLEMEPMSCARLQPKQVPAAKAIPPPVDLDLRLIHSALAEPWLKLNEQQRRECQENFENHANNDYYAEWFWFPSSANIWVNCWNTTVDDFGAEEFPSKLDIHKQFYGTMLMEMIQNASCMTSLISESKCADGIVALISRITMCMLPDREVLTYLPEAIHLRRTIHNVRVRNLEVEMPLVAKTNAGVHGIEEPQIDYAPVQRAWWDAMIMAYRDRGTCPQRMPLEMRIMGGSDVVMAPQRGNTLGTCAIAISTLHDTSGLWLPYAQQVLDKWMVLEHPGTRRLLKIRPHWAKEWQQFTVDGRPWQERLKKEGYKDEIEEFRAILADIGKEAGWTLGDLKRRFSNALFDDLFLSDV